MIIAKLGSSTFKLETLQDAETLLSIFNRATLIGEAYDSTYRDYQYVNAGESSLTIKVTQGGELLSLEQHLERQKERQEREAAKQAELAEKQAA